MSDPGSNNLILIIWIALAFAGLFVMGSLVFLIVPSQCVPLRGVPPTTVGHQTQSRCGILDNTVDQEATHECGGPRAYGMLGTAAEWLSQLDRTTAVLRQCRRGLHCIPVCETGLPMGKIDNHGSLRERLPLLASQVH